MARYTFTLTPTQLEEVTTQAKAELQKKYDAAVEKAKKEYDDSLESILKAASKGYVEKLERQAVQNKVWTSEEVQKVTEYRKSGLAAKAISDATGIDIKKVRAKLTAIDKQLKK